MTVIGGLLLVSGVVVAIVTGGDAAGGLLLPVALIAAGVGMLMLFATTAYVGMRIAFRNTDPYIRLVSATLT
ncbi:hypothetical protein ACWDKQ_14430, partial [Saccharopolyspora sp. NPDC000995]